MMEVAVPITSQQVFECDLCEMKTTLNDGPVKTPPGWIVLNRKTNRDILMVCCQECASRISAALVAAKEVARR